jgi:hypothetical protein
MDTVMDIAGSAARPWPRPEDAARLMAMKIRAAQTAVRLDLLFILIPPEVIYSRPGRESNI